MLRNMVHTHILGTMRHVIVKQRKDSIYLLYKTLTK
jgi:hypothetical protein